MPIFSHAFHIFKTLSVTVQAESKLQGNEKRNLE